MKTAWLPIALLLACTADEPVVDSSTDAGSSSTDTPTTDTPTTDTPTTDTPTTDTPTTDTPTTDDPSTTTDDSTTDVDPDSSSDDGSSSGDDTTTGPIPEECEGIEMVELLDPYVTPIESKTWTPGGSVTVGATMNNPGPEYTNYPSIVVESDNPLVTSGMPNFSLFAILEDMSAEVSVTFAADDGVEPGTEVTFTIYMASLDMVCANGDSIEVTATVE